jgi:hypothetical protein
MYLAGCMGMSAAWARRVRVLTDLEREAGGAVVTPGSRRTATDDSRTIVVGEAATARVSMDVVLWRRKSLRRTKRGWRRLRRAGMRWFRPPKGVGVHSSLVTPELGVLPRAFILSLLALRSCPHLCLRFPVPISCYLKQL